MQALYPIICPHCRQPRKVPFELEGKSIRCKGCKKSFVVELPAETETAKPAGIRHRTFSKQRLWGTICLVGVLLVIGFDLFWWFGMGWQGMDDFLEVPFISLGMRIWEVVISLFLIVPLGVIGLVLLFMRPRPLKVRSER